MADTLKAQLEKAADVYGKEITVVGRRSYEQVCIDGRELSALLRRAASALPDEPSADVWGEWERVKEWTAGAMQWDRADTFMRRHIGGAPVTPDDTRRIEWLESDVAIQVCRHGIAIGYACGLCELQGSVADVLHETYCETAVLRHQRGRVPQCSDVANRIVDLLG